MELPVIQQEGGKVYIQTWDHATKSFVVSVEDASKYEPSNKPHFPDCYPKPIFRLRPRKLRLFEKRMDKSGGCWLWLGAKTLNGYGVSAAGQGGRQRGAHVLAYRHWVGEVYEDHEIHHKCGVRECCNPEHLIQLTIDDHKRHHFPNIAWKAHPVRRVKHVKLHQSFEYKDETQLCNVCAGPLED